jgi:hypothetical protein
LARAETVQHGVIPIIGAKNENVIRLNYLCSIANGPVALPSQEFRRRQAERRNRQRYSID